MVTIRTIAQKAGVSTSTASRALNDNPRISDKTRERIKKLAHELGYRPNFSAQNLSRGEANIVGIVFPPPAEPADQPANPFHIEIMWGISKAVHQLNYEIMVAMGATTTELVNQVAAMAQQAKVHKFVLLYSQPADPVVKYLQEHELSYVTVGHPVNPHDRFVDNDNVAVGAAATNQLYELYHPEHPAFVQAKSSRSFENDRQFGYRQAVMERQGQPLIAEVNATTDLREWLVHHPETDGLVFSDDVLYLRYARQLKKFDLPVVCFNNSQWIRVVFNDQAVIDLQPQELGAKAIDLLFNPRQHHLYVPYKLK